MKTEKDVREMTAEAVGKDLLQAMLADLRLLPKPWDQLPSGKPVSDCPIVRAELVAQRMSGYKSRKDDEANGD